MVLCVTVKGGSQVQCPAAGFEDETIPLQRGKVFPGSRPPVTGRGGTREVSEGGGRGRWGLPQ